MDFNPDYPNPSSIAYRDSFLAAALAGGLSGVPDDVLSYAIDRAIGVGATPQSAGKVFADIYFQVAKQREPRGGYGSPTAYLLGAYNNALEDKKKL